VETTNWNPRVRPDWAEVGRDCMTRGGWKARIIWIAWHLYPGRKLSGYYAVHMPDHPDESAPVLHGPGGAVALPDVPGMPPTYEGHPADILGPWAEPT
jgi:hypothetical protein